MHFDLYVCISLHISYLFFYVILHTEYTYSVHTSASVCVSSGKEGVNDIMPFAAGDVRFPYHTPLAWCKPDPTCDTHTNTHIYVSSEGRHFISGKICKEKKAFKKQSLRTEHLFCRRN